MLHFMIAKWRCGEHTQHISAMNIYSILVWSVAALIIPFWIIGIIKGARKPELYSEDEMQAVHRHIERYYGESSSVFHELISPDIHVDIVIIPPTTERNYYTLVTMGMGAHRMNVPQEARSAFCARAELLITLPPDWKLDEESLKDERYYWPIHWLKKIARLPGCTNSWLAPTHTLSGEDSEPLAPDTEMCAFILSAQTAAPAEEASALTLPRGEKVSFYQLHPLYPDELEYALEHGSARLLNLLQEQAPPPINPARPHLRLPAPE